MNMTRQQIISAITDLADESSKGQEHKMTASLYFLASILTLERDELAADALQVISERVNHQRGMQRGLDQVKVKELEWPDELEEIKP